jgi:hypothetical protein
MIVAGGQQYPYAGTADKNVTFVSWSHSFYLTTAQSGANYWTVRLYFRKGLPAADVLISTIDTKTLTTANSEGNISTTTFSAATITATGFLYVDIRPTGAPGSIYITCPALRCKLT